MAITVLLATTFATLPMRLHAALPQLNSPEECRTALDNSHTLYSAGDKKAALTLLTHMTEYCESFAQVEHNLGVIAANNQQFDLAIEHLQQSLQLDRRSQHTLDQLQALQAYRASQAYGEALQLRSKAKAPTLSMQNSTYLNSLPPDATRAHSNLHNIATVEYELYDWWQSARDNNEESWLSHYEQHYPPPANAMAAPVSWDKTQRRINFTAQDVVAIISYQTAGALQHKQLLMRLQGNRWKIYQEHLLQ